jgi:sialate O-acetylesterase
MKGKDKTMSIRNLFVLLLAVGAGFQYCANAAVTLPKMFSSHMVLQRGMLVPIWGMAAPNEKVSVDFAGQKKETMADEKGKWKVTLDPMTASAEPRELLVSSANNNQPITINDVLVGEVWLGSGQSNMALRSSVFTTAPFNDAVLAKNIAAGPYPQIRLKGGYLGNWEESTPENLGRFSAMAFSFGLQLQKELNVPVGLIVGACEGTPSGLFITPEALSGDPACQALIIKYEASNKYDKVDQPLQAQYQATNYDEAVKKYQEALKTWEKADADAKLAGTKYEPRKPIMPLKAGECKGAYAKESIGRVYDQAIRLPGFISFAIRGILWDQGESGTAIVGVDQYTLMGALIRSWRKEWGQGDFPFIYFQKPSGGGCAWDQNDQVTCRSDAFQELPIAVPNDGEIRETYLRIMNYPNTFMVTSSDLGGTAHPSNKSGYGVRAAQVALGAVYGRDVEIYGPTYKSHRIEGNKVIISFNHIGKGLAFKNGKQLQGFALSGDVSSPGTDSRTFVWADARIDGDTLVVSSDKISKPTAVRYAWASRHPWANLFNKDGLPALSFRVDDLSSANDETKVCLTDKGKALFPIVIAKTASDMTKSNAATFASYLQKITGATFAIEEGDGAKGIAFGRQEDFSALPKRFAANPADLRRTEEYMLFSHSKGLLLVGASDLGTQNAMWDFLGRQGYRQYFPGPTWEIIPSVPQLTVRYDEVQKPDYVMRTIWFCVGTYPERGVLYKDWCRKNRMEGGFYINAGHTYDGILTKNKEIFLKHPEYLALVGGERKGGKFNVANSDLRKLVVEYKLAEMRSHPDQISVSMDPSDGGGWDESNEAKSIGSPSNQAITLANDVAEAIEKEFPGRFVGLYAYNYHSEPPTIKVHSNVFILVATSFRTTLLSMKDQMGGWKKQGAALGIRDYLSYPAANYDIPSRCGGGFPTINSVRRFKDYNDWGACLYSGESGDNWGIYGFTYYSVARILWNGNDTGFLEGFQKEFLTNCFGPVTDEIRPYYEALSRTGNAVLGTDFFHRLYAPIEAARAKRPKIEIDDRLDDLTLYVRYLELYKAYSDASGSARQQAVREMFSHLYRARAHSTNHAYGIIRDIAGRDRSLVWTDEEKKAFGSGKPLWETRAPYEKNEILAMSSDGLKNNPKLDFNTVNYSKELVPASRILAGETSAAPGSLGGQAVHNILYYTWADKPGSEWCIKVTCGTDAKGRPIDRIRPRLELWAAKEAKDEPVSVAEEYVDSGKTGTFVVKSPHSGLHWVILSGARWQKLELDPSRAWTVTSSSDIPCQSQGVAETSTLFFYVPKGTSVIGGHFTGRGELLNPNGQKVKNFDKDGYLKIKVPEGMDGHLWKVKDLRGGNFQLLTVPPYFAPSPHDLLLPREVVEGEFKLKTVEKSSTEK